MLNKTILVSAFVAIFLIGAIGMAAADKDLKWDNYKASPEAVANHNTPVSHDLITEDVLTESFDSWYPSGWDQIITNSSFTWYWGTTTYNSPPGSAMIEYDPALVPQDEWMITPAMDMSSVGSPVNVSFWFLTSYYWHVDPYDNVDLEIRVSTDNGSTWSDPLWTENEYGVFENWVWYEQTVNIDQVIGFPEVKVAFVYEGVDGAQANFDDIVISAEGQALEHDVGPLVFNSPGESGNPGDQIHPEIVFRNYGSNTETFDANLRIFYDGDAIYSETITIENLAPLNETTETFPQFTPEEIGVYDLAAIANLSNDQNPDNDVLHLYYDTTPISGVFYDFEANDGGFSGTNDWEYGTPSAGPSGAYSGTHLWGTDITGQYTVGPLLSELTTEPIGLGGDPVLTFYHWYHTEDGYDGGNVKISTDGGNWTIITPTGGYDGVLDNTYQNPIGGENAFFGGPFDWQMETFDLSAYDGQTVMFKFDYGSDESVITGYGWYLDDFFVEFTTGIDDHVSVPLTFNLSQNYPNPFNATTAINFSLPQASTVELTIYNMLGQKVETLVSGELPAGNHHIDWNASEVNSGVYFYRLVAGDNVSVQRMTLIK